MTLWRELCDESQRAPEALDMLLFLKRNPHVTPQWTQLLDDIDRKCAELQIPVERFFKRTRASRKTEEESRELNSSNKMNDNGVPEPSTAANDKPSANMTGSPDSAVVTRVNWNELCFFLAMQLEIATASSATTTSFPAPLSKNLRQLWPKKKVKRIADIFARCFDVRDTNATRCVCVYDGISELKNGQVKWVFLCDTFLSSLEAIQRERATRSAVHAASGGESVVDTREGDDTVTQTSQSVVHSAPVMVPSEDESSENESSATDAILAPPHDETEKQDQDQSGQQPVVAQPAEPEVVAREQEESADKSNSVTENIKNQPANTLEASTPASLTTFETEEKKHTSTAAMDEDNNVQVSRSAIELEDNAVSARAMRSKSEELVATGDNLTSAAASA